MVHMALAGVTRNPIIALSPQEAETLASSIAAVAEHYDIGKALSGPVMAWIGLAGTCAAIYGPRVTAIRSMAKTKKAADAKPAAPAMPQDAAFPQPGGIDWSMDIGATAN